MKTTLRDQVFISYSHEDTVWLERLLVMLHPLRHQLRLWDDGQIAVGQPWEQTLAGALARARGAVLLISPDFLASTFIREKELPHFLAEAAREESTFTVVGIAVRPSLADLTELGRYQWANSPQKPLSGLSRARQEKELARIAREIARLFPNP